ncbi:MAG TPA: HAD family hydrolase [Acidimicrobiia bacterium]|nr:HAD family hydrolase [Acidimicrobiia bacterium]
MPVPAAVLLDVGGVFLVPDHDRIRGAFERATCAISIDDLDRAHYAGARGFPIADQLDWPRQWRSYLDAYIDACNVPVDMREEVHLHLDSEFADAALWIREVAGARAGLRELETAGVRLGIVSNADGLIGQRLAELEILQVGPGAGVAVECIIDSGAVGVMKPDPRIFRIALEALGLEPEDVWYVGDMPGIDVVGARAAGIRPFIIDPFDLHDGADYERIGSLTELATTIAH